MPRSPTRAIKRLHGQDQRLQTPRKRANLHCTQLTRCFLQANPQLLAPWYLRGLRGGVCTLCTLLCITVLRFGKIRQICIMQSLCPVLIVFVCCAGTGHLVTGPDSTLDYTNLQKTTLNLPQCLGIDIDHVANVPHCLVIAHTE